MIDIEKQYSELEEIALAFEDKLSEAGIDFNTEFREVVANETGALDRPLGNVSINQATYRREDMNKSFNCRVMVSLFLTVQNLGERENRRAILKMVSAINRVLFHADIGIDLQDRIEPAGFNNVTDQERADAGKMLYQLNYMCSFNVDFQTETDLGIIQMIYNKFYLQEPSDDGLTDSESRIDLDETNGGNSQSEFIDDGLSDGGKAGTVFDDEVEYGGKADSTYGVKS